MKIPTGFTERDSHRIRELVDGYRANVPAPLVWQVPFVEKLRALPLYVGWTETLGIDIAGRLVRWSTEGEYEGLRPIAGRLDEAVALVEGAKAYPELRHLVPERPEAAGTCPDCNGTGILVDLESVICACGGLGWVVEEDAV